MDELHIYPYLLSGTPPFLGNMPQRIRLPPQAAGDPAAQLRSRPAREERSQYVDLDVRRQRYVASPRFAGSALTVVAPDLRRLACTLGVGPSWPAGAGAGLAHALPERRRQRARNLQSLRPGHYRLLPSPLRSPVQIIAAGDAVEAFLVTADARQLAPAGWSPQGWPLVRLFRHLRTPLAGEALKAAPLRLAEREEPGLASRAFLAAAAEHFGLAYYADAATDSDFLTIERIRP